MSDLLPLFLYEATLSLYPVSAEEIPLTDAPVWWGAAANELRLSQDYDEILMMSSGAKRVTAHHLDERHGIEIERTWILQKGSLKDFVPQRNQRYVLEIVWESNGYWYRRNYFGVTGRSVGWDSNRTLSFGNKQSYRAEYFSEESGYVPPVHTHGGSGPPPPPIYTPLPAPENGEEQSVGFFRENVLVQGEYLLGHYRWPVDAQLITAQVLAFAPQVSPVVLALEVNGLLVPGKTLSLPVGIANMEVTDSVTLTVNVAAGQSVRWKILSAPEPENSAYVCALVIQVQPL
jgi:hypothetical protein